MQQRVCDQCYALKKKCVIKPPSTSCLRCEKISLTCTTLRQQPRVGRPPKPSRGLPNTAEASLRVWHCSVPLERNITFSFLDDDDFYLHHDIYMLGSTFAPEFHHALVYCCQHSSHLLDDIFKACNTSLSWARFGILPANEVDVRSGSVSIRKLRGAVTKSAQDALAVLMLGQALAAFDTLIDCTATISILRYSLELVRPWYAEILTLESGLLEPVAIVPVFWDTIWCLLNSEIPVIDPRSVSQLQKGVVDRVVGMCTGLLPIMYDLCLVSCELARCTTNSQLDCQKRALETLAHRIRNWGFQYTSNLSRFTPVEKLSMETQASMYRTGLLLLIHRLHLHYHLAYSKNQETNRRDQTAQTLASEIFATREHFFTLAGTSAKLQNTSFPLLLALLEIPVPTNGLWESSTWLRLKPACAERLFGFVSEFWKWRDEGQGDDVFNFLKDRGGRGLVPLI